MRRLRNSLHHRADVPSRAAEKTFLPRRVLTYSHDGFGLGHLRRNFNIASRFVHELPDSTVLMLVSSPPGVIFDLPSGVDYVKLPSILKVAADKWLPRTLRIEMDELIDIRRSMIELAARRFRPDLVLVDYLAAGVQGELLPTLAALKSRDAPPRIVLGLRDILDAPDAVHKSWQKSGFYEVVRSYFDSILIYGCPSVVETAEVYGLNSALPGKAQYCGYLAPAPRSSDKVKIRDTFQLSREHLLVATGGGGFDAYPMLSLTMEAIRALGASAPDAILISGPLMPAAQRRALVEAGEGLPVRVLHGAEDCQGYLDAADLVVTMGSYNTLLEAIQLRKKVLVVPRSGPSAEQRLRAERLSSFGLVETLDQASSSPLTLARAILRKLADCTTPLGDLRIDGLETVVRRLIGWSEGAGAIRPVAAA